MGIGIDVDAGRLAAHEFGSTGGGNHRGIVGRVDRLRVVELQSSFGSVPIPFALSGEKRFQISGDDSIQRVFFRISRPVDGIDSNEGIAECKPLPIRPHNEDGNSHHGLRGKSGWTAITLSR